MQYSGKYKINKGLSLFNIHPNQCFFYKDFHTVFMPILQCSKTLFMQKKLLPAALTVLLFCLSFLPGHAQNVGIGTASPSALLEVAGQDAKINGIMVGKGGGNINSNVILGDSAMHNNITGSDNTAIGDKAMFNNIKGGVNVAVGRLTLYANISGIDNVAVGSQALFANDSGSINTAVGDWSLLHNTNGNYNTGIGGRALFTSSTGIANTGIGVSALRFSETGNYNTALGYASGVAVISGYGNTLIGSLADVDNADLYNAGAVGFNARVASSNSFVIGGTGAYAINVGINTTSPTEKLDVNGAIKVANNAYTGVTNNATAPIPSGGAGTIVFTETHFYGWNGTVWKQLDN